ncbi:MAG: hypothetical protein A3I07_02235 [Candidatus Doudnabacteria bacterium RIFCSPLOWO2_02_FULL_42_9]|uniref:Uncharacterized protein n=1 Tax=Candidatus Doudnabacteria bacterium RIFCSPHIGHO2_01_FULL_41_86 TaxID=1817821 RepID=A0A1F5N818_9BACT|nr:MAG: hypothetical protein A2717_04220 [Candidatus Doudnabacteria bacterium RIFCSPHIGHO2_01_FULL_41_86]OGE75308.1 MAG: hypothetical protein A3K07_00755 [Candidatus Doudnabacteria bacterium RIFCSPHIGHO2_01_43_10]OGE85834.1 MAG: hypothetical protein A3E28_03565 [Candidatus Doudnabacteria bacterium RIFCSPHIGHO2_12_FULL_42_22]OGE87328.1 MAG: hypothetical protein A3C49_01185 [Candidatus Doudnabacteria bacterium RIFCSPHIGHO2_02_FULL_42_25]OGE92166.1 MAG: hypothetical protein A2895_01060 [Candidatus
MKKQKLTPSRVVRNVSIVIGLVFIWRGIWYVMDGVDKYLFDGSHIVTSIAGVIAGLVILYLPDKDLKEIEKL